MTTYYVMGGEYYNPVTHTAEFRLVWGGANGDVYVVNGDGKAPGRAKDTLYQACKHHAHLYRIDYEPFSLIEAKLCCCGDMTTAAGVGHPSQVLLSGHALEKFLHAVKQGIFQPEPPDPNHVEWPSMT